MNGRRRTLGLFAALAAAAALPARAQDPRVSLAQKGALDWLALVDRGDAAASYKAASELYRVVIDEGRWAEAIAQMRQPLGAVVTRTLQSSSFHEELPGLPKGEYVMLLYRTAFANRPQGGERVTMVRDADGAWRVAGYLIG